MSNERWIKIGVDGERLPADHTGDDHAAVLDTKSNLLFYPHSIGVNGKRATQAKLKEAIAQLDTLGGGWRLAERIEAESILDLTRHGPAVDPGLFPGIKPEWHVTSTPAAWAPASAAWWVNFCDVGVVFVDDLSCGGWALAVRPAGQ